MADLTRMGDGARRAVETLLRGAGGRSVLLRMPRAGASGDVTEQLGLLVATFDDLELAPAVLRRLGAASAQGARDRYEVLLPAEAVAKAAGGEDVALGLAVFAAAAGVVVDGAVRRIVNVSYCDVSGMAFLYRVALEAAVMDEL